MTEAPPPVTPTSTGTAPHALDRPLLKGIAWTGAMRWAVQLLTWGSTLVVARLLRPADYGIMGMALVYVEFVQLVNQLGLGAAIVQRRDLTEDHIARLGGLAIVGGVGLAAISAALAAPISLFFGEPAVRWVIIVLSLGLVTTALQVLPKALLARELNFRKLAWLDGVEALVSAATTITLAATGLGYWALVIGVLAGRVVSTGVAIVWRPHRLAWPRRFHTISGAVQFGWHIVVTRVAWYLYSNADFAIVGRLLGKVALGAYTVGWTIASIPVDRVTAFLGNVTGPVFAAVQDDHAALRRYLRLLTEGVALITFPAAVGLALVADEFVLVVLGQHWQPAILPLRLLALSAASRSVSPLLPQIAVSTGHTKRNMQLTIVATILLPGLFYLGTHWGTAGVAFAWLVGHPLLVMPLFLTYALYLIRMRLVEYLKAVRPAVEMTAVMALVVLGVRAATPSDWGVSLRLALHVLSGVAAYAVMVRYHHSDRVKALRVLWRQLKESTA